MSEQQQVISTVDIVIAGVIAGGCVWLLGAMFSWSWNVTTYAGLGLFFFLISIGQLAVIRSGLRANQATMEMNQRQANTETGPPPVGSQQQEPAHQAPPKRRAK